MSVEPRDYDYWDCYMCGIPCGLFFYYVNGSNIEETAIIGNCGAIQSAQLVPFITEDELKIYSIQYDIDRFGDSQIYAQKFNLLTDIKVKRIDNITTVKKELATFNTYQINKDVGGPIHYKNESRLYNYPYSFAYITDHLNPPLEVKYHLCKYKDSKLMVKNSISDRCSYGLYIEGYKGDNNGTMEALVSTDAHEIPVSSNAYANWVATNKNQATQNIRNMQLTTMLQNQGIAQQTVFNGLQNVVSTAGSGAGAIASGLMGDISGAVSNTANAINSTIGTIGNVYNSTNQIALNNRNVQNTINSYMAQASDMKSVPNTMLSMGSDVYYGLINGDAKVYLYRMGLTNEMKIRLGDYFALYGYKQNQILNIATIYRRRYYYNYIRTVGCNISGEIPRKYLEKLKSIFDNGVTLWHMDREGVEPLNWSISDNYEYNS